MRRATWAGVFAGSAAGATAALVGLSAFAAPAPACAAVRTVPDGFATHYKAGGGNCAYPVLPADHYLVALSEGEYAGARACGTILEVTGPARTIRVLVVDRCGPCKPGEIDLSEEAFAALAPLGKGRIPVSYRTLVDPPVENLAVRVRGGSNPYWLSLLVMGHGNPLRSVRARAPGRPWTPLVLTDYNAWQAPHGLGKGPFAVEITDIRGHRAQVTGIRLIIDLVQRTRTRLYGTQAKPSKAAPTPRPSKKPRPTVVPELPAPPPRTPVPAAARQTPACT
ncbi:hypothetical protein GCM10027589_52830 [Actinocorallia lasiicapitis]